MEKNNIDIERVKKAAKKIKAIANARRVEVISMLEDGPLNVTEIYGKLQVDQPVASVHLNELKHYGYLNSKRDGKKTFYSLNDEALVHILNSVDDFVQL
ncbi:MAG: metalloregulator ArsR/SmtB family transcription factor [Saprospiraceae bacterium]|nr:metalloregulator ArsR/SmtB family transcription factor [Saprospiraceae bacterium]